MTKEKFKQIVDVLNLTELNQEDLVIFENLLDNAGTEIDLIDRNRYFASVLWADEDIIGVLKEHNLDATEEVVCTVADAAKASLEDCSAGFEVIEQVIRGLPLL